MQWLSIYGDSKSSLSEILLDSWERFMNLFLCCWLKVWVLLIKLPQGWSRSPRRCPVWPPHPAGVHGGLRVLQQLAPKVLRQLVFPSTWPFPLTLFFSYLYSSSTSRSFLQPPLVTHTPSETFQHFQCFLFPFCFKLQGHWIKDKVVSTPVSVLWHSFNLFPLPAFSFTSLFHCLGWLQRREIGRREDTATGSRSKRGKRGECKLLSRLQRTAQRHECEY